MNKLKLLAFVTAFLFVSQQSNAQPVPGDDGPGSPCEYLPPEFQPEECVPVDSYMYLLAVAGMLLVAKHRKKIFA
jgi:hypothetical protein